ncbi:Domain of uncharacterised function (DUF3842) [Chlamydia abortus]|uniref:DUF3842 family protein n=1 Tax=Paenibacillus residui TaxID=629724 RepID=A0ABW3DI93_9BACL|nr:MULTISPECIES: DUF3842 family protein [Paenibacillaceae]SHE13250.1 Domain of uncharacterised function (DUF3842) [Chlamydia abortus]
MRIAVVDGQGGGIGKALVEKLKQELPDIHVIALGTNALATSLMLKAGANEGASGENAIVFNAPRVQIIAGGIGIIGANSMLGELTPLMAKAISESPARKVLIPFNRCHLHVVGVKPVSLPELVEEAVSCIKQLCGEV